MEERVTGPSVAWRSVRRACVCKVTMITEDKQEEEELCRSVVGVAEIDLDRQKHKIEC